MKETPILMNTDMVTALLTGRKTQTRRLNGLKFENEFESPDRLRFYQMNRNLPAADYAVMGPVEYPDKGLFGVKCPYGKIGDLLWIREAWQFSVHLTAKKITQVAKLEDIVYKAPGSSPVSRLKDKWKPGIHLKKEHARIWLQITGIRLERIYPIAHSDAIAEGIEEIKQWPGFGKNYKDYQLKVQRDIPGNLDADDSYYSLFEKINGEGSVKNNPWVWVIEFKVISQNGKP